MDPITKALHETWKTIVNEGKAVEYIDPKTGKREIRIVGKDMLDISDIEKYIPKPTPGARVGQGLIDFLKPKPTPGGRIPVYPGEIGPPPIFPKPKPKPTPTPGDGSWGGSKPKPGTGAWGGAQPGKPIYGPDGNLIGVEDNTTPTPKPTPKKDEFIPYINPNPSPFPRPRYIEREPKPIIPTRTPAPQPAAPVTTGSGLLNNIMNINKKAYNLVSGSLPTMPKIYEERDAEGQMAKGELMVLASKAQELANMMKDDTQLEAWVQSKITKAKDYISSVHDYMNGNPDKID